MIGEATEMAGTNEIVRMTDVSKTYRGPGAEEAALKSVSFHARPGELILLLGPSGSGKTRVLMPMTSF